MAVTWRTFSITIFSRKINSHLIQTIEAPRHTEHMLTDWAILLRLAGKELCQRSHTSQHGHEPEIPISALGTSHMIDGIQNVFGDPVLSRKAWRTKLSSSHQNVSVRHSQHPHTMLEGVAHRVVHRGHKPYVQQWGQSSDHGPSPHNCYHHLSTLFSLGTYVSKNTRELQRELLIYNIILQRQLLDYVHDNEYH